MAELTLVQRTQLLPPQHPGAFPRNGLKAFAIAYLVGVPMIFFLAPVTRKRTAKLLCAPQ